MTARTSPARYAVWAPKPERVRLVVDDVEYPMRRDANDWWSTDAIQPARGARYGFRLGDDDLIVPDPRSRYQPDGVHGTSEVVESASFPWTDERWRGRSARGAVIYELHLGTFTPEGTLDAAADRLEYLRELGIDLIELLPVNDFNGSWNWGYDGVDWFAIHGQYGGPDAYRRFVDRAHSLGLGVIQDVVYNHLGPSGNYLPLFGPYLVHGLANTWGDSVNVEHPEVRRFVLDNVRMWFSEYHVDGLRLDAVHAIRDTTRPHILADMASETQSWAAHVGKPLSLIAESDLNDPTMFLPKEAHGFGLTGQWSDDFHHALHVALTGETTGYYADFAPLGALAKTLERGFFHDGTWSSFRNRRHGIPIDRSSSPTTALVACLQNHDQVGNRAVGDRLSGRLDDAALVTGAAILLLGPFTPMLFMGEEFAASTPWQFFTSHPESDLGEATAKGRIAEFERMGWDPSIVPDPQDPATFERSKLDWDELDAERGSRILAAYRALIALRHGDPSLTDWRYTSNAVDYDEDARWLTLRRGLLEGHVSGAPPAATLVAAHFGDGTVSIPVLSEPGDTPDPTSVVFAFGAVDTSRLSSGSITITGTGVVVLK
ncbi:malto-oligosyltrehalose trehalohydrolase [Curtobacterium ammoniigenes]|uniref:malto-oligosyltrehalose trehalohydrolase n=1 Tax=Curtobacterium ammoniigenes TaxID=395387 RepID=UPI0008379066|nr:malto-oligosyltrehalose trehalohydrolase [Curtobacterium ammoniigenes]